VSVAERERIEQALAKLKGVEAVRVCFEKGEIAEIHVAAQPGARAKNVARDVRTYLAAALGIPVSHQKISVAVCGKAQARSDGAAPAEGEVRRQTRLLFRSVNLLVEGLRSQVQVELSLDGRNLLGTAAGVPCALGTERLVVRATLDALQQAVGDDLRILDGDLVFTRAGSSEAAVVEVVLVWPRSEQRLLGACAVGQDRHRSVVFATLDAVNRIFERLAPQHWIEFEVEAETPESSEEDAGKSWSGEART
jgi:hypothetical protein